MIPIHMIPFRVGLEVISGDQRYKDTAASVQFLCLMSPRVDVNYG